MKYLDYVNLKYKPSKDDLVVEFYIEPNKVSIKKAAGAVAAESSTGTWSEVKTEKKYMKKLSAKVFEIKGNLVKIAYPIDLFEQSSIPNLLSSIAGNIFGMKIVKNIKLLDASFPGKYVKGFRGPKFGIKGVRKVLKVKKRPLLGTIIKPKIGLNPKDHAKVAYEAWLGGCDLVKDDENLASQKFNIFEKRVLETLKMMEKAERETGEKKGYIVNITAETHEMVKRAYFVLENNGNYMMVDILTVGFSALQTLRNQDFNLILHAHRAGHAALTRNKKHGISMLFLAKIARMVGVDQLHTGTANVGKMESDEEETIKVNEFLRSKFFGLKKVFPVASGGLHPGSVPRLVNLLGKDIIIQAGGGIHGHPKGTLYGAKAMREAIEAVVKGYGLEEYSKKHKALELALKKWR